MNDPFTHNSHPPPPPPPPMPHICVSEVTIIGSDNGVSAGWHQAIIWTNSAILQFWNIVDSNLRNKLRLNLKRNSNIFIQEIAFETAVCEMAAISS